MSKELVLYNAFKMISYLNSCSMMIKIMKKKVDKFNEDELLRDMYYKRDLNRAANESEKQEMYKKGALKEVINFIEVRYGTSEEKWIFLTLFRVPKNKVPLLLYIFI